MAERGKLGGKRRMERVREERGNRGGMGQVREERGEE